MSDLPLAYQNPFDSLMPKKPQKETASAYDVVKDGMTPSDVFELLKQAKRDHDVELAFELAEGLYWFCSDWYDGQGDPLYSILCSLNFHPGCLVTGPDTGDAQYVYDILTGTLPRLQGK